MKFDYCVELGVTDGVYPEYRFQFILTDDEIRNFQHKYGCYNIGKFLSDYQISSEFYKIYTSIRLIEDALIGEKVDLGINYKKKYEELVELLNPHRIDDSMEPATTLKMILRYGK